MTTDWTVVITDWIVVITDWIVGITDLKGVIRGAVTNEKGGIRDQDTVHVKKIVPVACC